jgi:predicted ferric reductase
MPRSPALSSPPRPTSWLDRLLRIAVYALLLALPLGVSLLVHGDEWELSAATLGKAAPLLGFGLVTLQFALSARLVWGERPFGLDRVYRFHKAMGALGVALLLAHPVLLALGGHGPGLLTDLRAPWYLWTGKTTLLLAVGLGLVAGFRAALRLPFHRWRPAHGLVAAAVLIGGPVHALGASADLHHPAIRIVVLALALGALATYARYRLSPSVSGRTPNYRIEALNRETPDAWTLTLAPRDGANIDPGLPGQFRFVWLRLPSLGGEDHPFTVASAPDASGRLSFTVKGSGDFTQHIHRAAPGDPACLSPPFGRFSYPLHPREDALVFVGGGIGITPLMSMIRHLRATGDDREVLLLYGNRREADIAFREELAAIAAQGPPRLRVVHVLSRPGPDWTGEVGRLERALLQRRLGDTTGKGYYVCGPPGMLQDTVRALRSLGVPSARLHHERFVL